MCALWLRWRQADPAFDQQDTSALTGRAVGPQPRSGPAEVSVGVMSRQEAVQHIKDFLRQAEQASELDVDHSYMDGPFA